MTLGALLEGVDVGAVSGPTDREVSDLCYDSRRVSPGAVFFGLAGLREDGARYARQALAAGAAAVVMARGTAVDGATVVEVEEPRKALAQAAARFHGHPERALKVVGVTGTNGKTTTTWMLESIFRAAGWRAGVIGTIGVRLADEQRPAVLTTPESPELFGLLREMVERGVQAVAIEVSSHALVQRRAFGLACEVAVFTNLSHDHLDYHGTMERYLDAKLMLFDGRNLDRAPGAWTAWTAVVDADDPAAARVVAAARRGGGEVASFGEAEGARYRIAALAPRERGLSFELRHDGARTPIALPLLGRHNAWNAAGAFAAARALGIAPETAASGLAAMPVVPGRLERVEAGQPFLVVVDYAHTPDALQRALAAAREHGGRRVLLVFGCGGGRDRAKRPAMGRVAAEGCDRAWVTSDNPRGEDPAAIAADIRAGVPGGALALELDRRAAIVAAIAAARAGDVVLIAGKGHETTQTIGARVLPFDDRAVAREALRALAAGRP
ncbi:MAG: UDP-N-acetylmuramoyl-L-alanyl-D-glutamate--2,6-diaminopimelate ligase [Candidatus Eisenbacteria bacterium]